MLSAVTAAKQSEGDDDETVSILSEEPKVHQKIRGTYEDPITSETIKETRDSIIEGYTNTTEQLLLKPQQAFEADRIVAYNVVLEENGRPKEQYVTSSGPNRSGSRDERSEDEERIRARTTRMHERADAMLEDVLKGKSKTKTTDDATAEDWDVDFGDWSYFGGSSIYHHFDEAGGIADNPRPGGVDFDITIRKDEDEQRIGARTFMRFEAGRELCNDGHDEYCIDGTVHTGMRNKKAVIKQDWDKGANGVSTEDLLTGVDPTNDLDDTTTSRQASIGLDLSRDPGLSVGYSSGVTLPEASLTDRTTMPSGFSHHEFEVNSSDGDSAKYSAEIEVGSAARYDFSQCDEGTHPVPDPIDVVEIDIEEIEWGLRLPGTGWVNTHSDDRQFTYSRTCYL
ncbi:hypothetical protein C490_17377 [Natronobacterium gregoryi SP2]|nr:hypothetical protein C490_17377 [Natronobacterium gregoryi SP2]